MGGTFQNANLCTMSYEDVRQAMKGAPYPMSLTGTEEIASVITAVNIGIDSHLEACFCPERGDSYTGGERRAGKFLLCRTLECRVSPESLPVLLRRLTEMDFGGDSAMQDAGMSLAEAILSTLQFDDCGVHHPEWDE
jgi:hypothetical protein